MSAHKQSGFTLVELMISIGIAGLIVVGIYSFFGSSIKNYFTLQEDSIAFSGVAAYSQRIASVVRGTTNITEATNNSLTMYAYFSPNDQYVSLIHYYPSDSNTKFKADVTRMTANPPIGSLINGSQKTFTIIDSFYLPSGVNTFEYLDSAGGTLSMPISDLQTIKGVRVNLATKPIKPGATSTKMSVEVSLRNKKTNL